MTSKKNIRRIFLYFILTSSLFLFIFNLVYPVTKCKKSVNCQEISSTSITNDNQTEEPTQQEMINQTSAKPMLILFWSKYFGKPAPFSRTNETLPPIFFTTLEKGDCPIPCEVSTNRSRANEASAFIVHARDPRPLPPSKSVPWILHTRENPVYESILTRPQFMSQFKFLTSYHLDSHFPTPCYTKPDLTPPIPFKEKKGIMAAISNCERVRTEYLRRLMKHIQVDSYGRCLRNKKGMAARKSKEFKRGRTEITRQYKFTMVIMNQDCDSYVDDRLSHTLSSGSVPVYMGTDTVEMFLPGNLNKSIIKIRDFKSPKHLADYLKYLSNNETAYNKYLEWKSTGLGDISDTAIGRYWNLKYPTMCQICMELSKGKLPEGGLKPVHCRKRRYEDWGLSQ